MTLLRLALQALGLLTLCWFIWSIYSLLYRWPS